MFFMEIGSVDARLYRMYLPFFKWVRKFRGWQISQSSHLWRRQDKLDMEAGLSMKGRGWSKAGRDNRHQAFVSKYAKDKTHRVHLGGSK